MVTDAKDKFWLGAENQDSNAGEITAIAESLLWLNEADQTKREAFILYDSELAANLALNRQSTDEYNKIIEVTRKLLSEGQRKRKINFLHVKAHSGNIGNELVDFLAKKGRDGEFAEAGRYAKEDLETVQISPTTMKYSNLANTPEIRVRLIKKGGAEARLLARFSYNDEAAGVALPPSPPIAPPFPPRIKTTRCFIAPGWWVGLTPA